MSIQQLRKTKQDLMQSIDQHKTLLKENRFYRFLLRQTEGFSIPFLEAIGIGVFVIWVISLGIFPPVVQIFTEPIFAFGIAVVLLIPVNFLLSKITRKYRKEALQKGKLVELASTYFQEKSKFWDGIFKEEATKRVVPSKEEIIDTILEESASVLIENSPEIHTMIKKDPSIRIAETSAIFDIFGKLLVIEFDAEIKSKNLTKLIVSPPYVFKCNNGKPKSIKKLLPTHSNTLALLKTITNLISQRQISHIITSGDKIGIIFEEVVAPSEANIEGYTLLPSLLENSLKIFQ